MSRLLLALLLMSGSVAAAQPASESKLPKNCKPAELTSSGSATSEEKAKRNAKVSLMAHLSSQYPGDYSARLLGTAGFKCENRILWLCAASVRYCK